MTRKHVPVWRQAEPVRDTWRDHAADALQIVLGVIVFGTLLLGIFAWMAIAAAAQVAP